MILDDTCGNTTENTRFAKSGKTRRENVAKRLHGDVNRVSAFVSSVVESPG